MCQLFYLHSYGDLVSDVAHTEEIVGRHVKKRRELDYITRFRLVHAAFPVVDRFLTYSDFLGKRLLRHILFDS